MIVSFSLIRRREDIPLAAFQAHWLDPHGVLAARIPGTRRYVQNHVIDGPGTNARAHALRLDGFAQLAFGDPQSRLAAHNSTELKACDKDSELFIGAVSRVICDDGDVDPPADAANAVKQIVLTTGKSAETTGVTATLSRLDLVGLRTQRILSQAGAPGSAVPFHGIVLATLHELWIRDAASVTRNAAMIMQALPELATFQVRPHVFR